MSRSLDGLMHWSCFSRRTFFEGAKSEYKEEIGIECEPREWGKFMTPKWQIVNGLTGDPSPSTKARFLPK